MNSFIASILLWRENAEVKTFKPQEWRGYTERNRINYQHKFSWPWLKKNVQTIIDRNSEATKVENFLVVYVKLGKAVCIWCYCEINYCSGGPKRSTEHTEATNRKQVIGLFLNFVANSDFFLFCKEFCFECVLS